MSHPEDVPVDARTAQQMLDAVVKHNTWIERCGFDLKPKNHQLVHFVQRSLHDGAPRLYTTYREESFNGVLARVGRSVHALTWEAGVLYKIAYLQELARREGVSFLQMSGRLA